MPLKLPNDWLLRWQSSSSPTRSAAHWPSVIGVYLGNQLIWIWDAESLAVFKMMFFRRKDIADVEQILRTQSAGSFERDWVREHLISIYGPRDPRVAQWDELVAELS